MVVLYILLAIVVLLLMIMIHETGHYLAGKILKFEIEEYSIGFGPKIFSKKLKSGEVFSLRWIPLGGFCAFKGEDEDEDNSEDTTGCFNSYPCWKRLIVLFAGAFFNFVSGILFTFILLTTVGSGIAQIKDVVATNSNKDVLFENDIILEVDGREPTLLNGGIVGLMSEKDVGEDIVLTINRDGEIIDVTVQKYQVYETDEEGNNVLDEDGNPIVAGKVIGITSEYVKLSFGSALIKCVPYTFDIAWETLKMFGQLITGELDIKNDVGGPITTISMIASSTQANIKNLLLLFPLLAVNLAVFNLLPIPALDGARMVFVLIEWIFRKPVPRNIEAKIHGIGLLVLFGFVIIVDILHFF